jgi:hypothetical protein
VCNIPTKDCAMGGENGGIERNMLDLSLLFPKKGEQDMGYYCNCGPTGHDMEEGHPYKAMYTCDLVLSMGCYDRCKQLMGRRTSRQRK